MACSNGSCTRKCSSTGRSSYKKRKSKTTYTSNSKQGYKDYTSTNATAGGAALTYGNRQLAILYNPFSFKNNSPKWPDGLATYSIGRKMQRASEIIEEADFGLVLFPGMNNWLVAFTQSTGSNIILNHCENETFDWSWPASSGNAAWAPTDQNRYSAWRPVSTAVKFKHVNSDEDNEGWFEAIRTSRNTLSNKFGILYSGAADALAKDTSKPNKVQATKGDVYPGSELTKAWLASDNWSMQPTYVTGKLKDIGYYIFQLNSERRDNEFNRVKNVSVKVSATTEETVNFKDTGTGKIVIPKEIADSVSPGEIVDFSETFLSPSFDCIIIRIHGTSKTRLMAHSVNNIEMLVPEDSLLAQYQTISYAATDALEAFISNRQKFHKMPMHSLKHSYQNQEDWYYN